MMASLEGDSQPAVGSGGSDVHIDASLSTADENAVHKADTEAQCMLINCIHCSCNVCTSQWLVVCIAYRTVYIRWLIGHIWCDIIVVYSVDVVVDFLNK